MADIEADDPVATPTLDASDIALVAELGERRQVRQGEYLYRERSVHEHLAFSTR